MASREVAPRRVTSPVGVRDGSPRGPLCRWEGLARSLFRDHSVVWGPAKDGDKIKIKIALDGCFNLKTSCGDLEVLQRFLFCLMIFFAHKGK